jgi:hypothetical protein
VATCGSCGHRSPWSVSRRLTAAIPSADQFETMETDQFQTVKVVRSRTASRNGIRQCQSGMGTYICLAIGHFRCRAYMPAWRSQVPLRALPDHPDAPITGNPQARQASVHVTTVTTGTVRQYVYSSSHIL